MTVLSDISKDPDEWRRLIETAEQTKRCGHHSTKVLGEEMVRVHVWVQGVSIRCTGRIFHRVKIRQLYLVLDYPNLPRQQLLTCLQTRARDNHFKLQSIIKTILPFQSRILVGEATAMTSPAMTSPVMMTSPVVTSPAMTSPVLFVEFFFYTL